MVCGVKYIVKWNVGGAYVLMEFGPKYLIFVKTNTPMDGILRCSGGSAIRL